MVSHERKLFKPCYRPAPLTYAVRRSATAFPDGSLSLEDAERAPVAALSRRVDVPGDEPRAVRLPLGAATIVECQGETYAHAYTARTFAGARPAPLQLVASAPVEAHERRAYYDRDGEGRGLADDDAALPVVLQMGKVGKDCFNMDYTFPFSMLQAFAVCLARFDTGVPLATTR